MWRSTVQNPSQPNSGWWWGSWIAAQLIGAVASATFTITGEPRGYMLENLVWLELLVALATTISLVGWFRIVRTISEAQDALAGGASQPAGVQS